MDGFMAIPNYELCLNAIRAYMRDQYQVDINTVPSMDAKTILFKIMKELRNEAGSDKSLQSQPLKELNNIALNRMKDTYVGHLKLAKRRKPVVHHLDRDASIYGDRKVHPNLMLPLNTNMGDDVSDDVMKSFDVVLSTRNKENQLNTPPVNSIGTKKEDPIDADDFQKQLNLLERDRENHFLQSSIETQMPFVANDPKALFAEIQSSQKQMEKETSPNVPTSKPVYVNHQQMDLIERTSTKHIRRYLTINGFDREWVYYPLRFQFAADMTKLARVYRNISAIAVTSIVIPMEIVEEKSLTNAAVKTMYQNGYKMNFPYISLNIEEIGDMYDGMNNNAQRVFGQFLFDTSYKSDNGRGYVILVPAQEELKEYMPHPLASLQRLTFSLRKPNGTLLNQSRDDNKIVRLEYDTYNSLYIQVVLENYFDKNEFYAGDIVRFKDFILTHVNGACVDSPSVYNRVNEYINATQGHEIVQMGMPNEHGFYKNFFILAPSILDNSTGKLEIEKPVVDAIREFNNHSTTPAPPGHVLNMSLQPIINMTIHLNVSDSSMIKSQII
jgi:signal peptidase I